MTFFPSHSGSSPHLRGTLWRGGPDLRKELSDLTEDRKAITATIKKTTAERANLNNKIKHGYHLEKGREALKQTEPSLFQQREQLQSITRQHERQERERQRQERSQGRDSGRELSR